MLSLPTEPRDSNRAPNSNCHIQEDRQATNPNLVPTLVERPRNHLELRLSDFPQVHPPEHLSSSFGQLDTGPEPPRPDLHRPALRESCDNALQLVSSWCPPVNSVQPLSRSPGFSQAWTVQMSWLLRPPFCFGLLSCFCELETATQFFYLFGL